MTCDTMAELLSDLIDGALDPSTTDEALAHLSACRHCIAVHDAVRDIVEQAPSLRTTLPDSTREGLWSRIAVRIDEGRGG